MSESTNILAAAYAAIESRRGHLDAMAWQVPTIGIAAQAFLITVITDGGSRTLIVRVLAVVIGLAAAQLMSRYRYLERLDSMMLEDFESNMSKRFGEDWDRAFLSRTNRIAYPHSKPTLREDAVFGPINKPRSIGRIKSGWIWQTLLYVLAGVAIVIPT